MQSASIRCLLAGSVHPSRVPARGTGSRSSPGTRWALRAAPPGAPPGGPPDREAFTLLPAVAASAAAAAAAAVSYQVLGPEASLSTGDDVGLVEAALGSQALGLGLGAGLWAASTFFASPLQLLLLFLGRIDTERPSDWTLRLLGRLAGQPVESSGYEPPAALFLANVAVFAAFGAAISLSLSAALGEETWGVSSGLGSCLAAGVYELGRPPRLSAPEREALEARYAQFVAFADARLQKRGRIHISEVSKALRSFYPAYRCAKLADLAVAGRRSCPQSG